jgi:hypothetical protein
VHFIKNHPISPQLHEKTSQRLSIKQPNQGPSLKTLLRFPDCLIRLLLPKRRAYPKPVPKMSPSWPDAHSFDIVPNGIQHKASIVPTHVLGPQAGLSVALPTCLECCIVEGVYDVAI